MSPNESKSVKRLFIAMEVFLYLEMASQSNEDSMSVVTSPDTKPEENSSNTSDRLQKDGNSETAMADCGHDEPVDVISNDSVENVGATSDVQDEKPDKSREEIEKDDLNSETDDRKVKGKTFHISDVFVSRPTNNFAICIKF